jgi:NAD-dependent deacetylase sirtuin 5
VLSDIDEWMSASEKIDLIMVVGTSAKVYPAAGYVDAARAKGARVAIVNMDKNDVPPGGLYKGDWFFQGDAAVILPEILKSVVGEVEVGGDTAVQS